MSAAVNVTKYVERTDILPEPVGNSLRDYLSGWFRGFCDAAGRS
jgi:hypothetical protein